MFELKIKAHTVQEIQNILHAISVIPGSNQLEFPFSPKHSLLEEKQVSTESKPKKVKKANNAKAEEVAEAAVETKEAGVSGLQFSASDARAALTLLIAKGEAGIKTGVEILNSFGADKLSELKPEQFGSFIEKVNATISN